MTTARAKNESMRARSKEIAPALAQSRRISLSTAETTENLTFRRNISCSQPTYIRTTAAWAASPSLPRRSPYPDQNRTIPNSVVGVSCRACNLPDREFNSRENESLRASSPQSSRYGNELWPPPTGGVGRAELPTGPNGPKDTPEAVSAGCMLRNGGIKPLRTASTAGSMLPSAISWAAVGTARGTPAPGPRPASTPPTAPAPPAPAARTASVRSSSTPGT
mmetsp:Transcript_23925/g.52260  ORF Transcript_23925/g.52260 Transcript_23925/m.52260 type:complete len:221 (+) Transcript_23925:292-954(+)